MKKLFIESIPLVEPRPSGVGHSLAGLTSALITKKFGYEVVLVAPKRGMGGLKKWPKLNHCATKPLPIRTKILNGLIKFHLLPYVDLLIGRGTYLFGNFKNWPLSDKSNSLTFIHDICYVLHPEFVSPPNQRYLEKNIPYFMKRTDIILTVSEQSKKEICEYYQIDQGKVSVVHNGVEENFYTPVAPEESDRVKKKYEINKPYFLYVGNIEPRKNIIRLIQAFSTLPQAIANEMNLVLVGGNGWLNEGIIEVINKYTSTGISIIKPGQFVNDEDVSVLMSNATALIQPSIHEGFSMPPLEAMAAGTIVGVSDIPVHKEILGPAALYFDPLSVESVAQTLTAILGLSPSVMNKMKKSGRERSRQFSWDKSADQLIQALGKLK